MLADRRRQLRRSPHVAVGATGELHPLDAQAGGDRGPHHGADLEFRPRPSPAGELRTASWTASWRKRVKTGLQTAISQL